MGKNLSPEVKFGTATISFYFAISVAPNYEIIDFLKSSGNKLISQVTASYLISAISTLRQVIGGQVILLPLKM